MKFKDLHYHAAENSFMLETGHARRAVRSRVHIRSMDPDESPHDNTRHTYHLGT